ncbi:hypothetical protein ASC77_02850 [Nocardioides sp. Root1257]|uniref:DUF4333 domain-containing protein n=1 Tax=unclassified Nocardioides TaxID=2615069 RepID=UPI000701C6AD|nr:MULTISPECIES: DUF4333 domain-containing protein [unclassified Nocardioides]KQW53249.1 hypothetical protein ASC77_02850 [Nocardioides sp. Root1257]KRC55935.1 hypothetical protein ASE24_02850 [Nocardioides sp. Root224]
MTLRRALTAAAIAPVLLALGACSGSVSVGGGGYDPADVADQVQKAQQDVTPDLDVSDASCPDDSDPEKGASIECTVTIEGVEAPYTVTFTTVTDDDVKFDIAPAQAIISTDKVVDYLLQQATDQGLADAEADCGDDAVIVQDPDTTFGCTLLFGDDSQDVTLRVKDLDGTVSLES